MKPQIPVIRAEFIAYLGREMESQGLSPIAGRMLGLLIFDGEARSFSDLATELGVSRGSISVNARLLVERGAIEKVNHPGDRQDYFRVASATYDVILLGIAGRARSAADGVASYAKALPDEAAGPRKRLCSLSGFYAAMASAVEEAARRIRGA